MGDLVAYTSHPIQQKKAENRQNQGDIFDRINLQLHEFFSKGWNIIRFVFFIIVALYLIFVLISAISSVPEGEPLTWSHFFSHILQNFYYLRDNFPVFGFLFQKISDLVSARQVNFLIFLSALFGTISLLVCFCP